MDTSPVTDPRSDAENQVRDTGEPSIDDHLFVAKEHGIYLTLEDDHKTSAQRQEIVQQFLKDMVTLQNDEGSVPMSAPERRRLRRNPVCKNCKEQFQEDDNPSACCKYHPGKSHHCSCRYFDLILSQAL